MILKYILVFEIYNIDLHAIGPTTLFFYLWSPIPLRMEGIIIRRSETAVHCMMGW